MVLRPRTRLQLRRAVMTAALGALVVPATAGAATKAPVIRSVTPKTATVGAKLTITGKYFRRGKGKNSVLFRSDRGKTLFVKADVSTAKKLKVVVPKKLEKYMLVTNGAPSPTRFRLKVLTRKLGKTFTSLNGSPVISPERANTGGGDASGGAGVPTAPDGDCDGDGVKNSVDGDDDNDLVDDALELKLGLDPCNVDTDGDGVEDGYEYQSALDLNDDDYQHMNGTVPYPGKRPYPNPLDPTDANTDFDGDGLTQAIEYRLWRYSVAHNGEGNTLTPLSYSDGLKYSKYTRDANEQRVPALSATSYSLGTQFMNWANSHGYGQVRLPDSPGTLRLLTDFDRNGTPDALYDTHGEYLWSAPDGFLSDDERDEDGDGLSNYQETIGPMQGQSWWTTFYPGEKPFTAIAAFETGTQVDDPDTDGDGILDGADDQDHDDYPNIVEQSRERIVGDTTDNKLTASVALADDHQPTALTTLVVNAKTPGLDGNRLTVEVTSPTTNTRKLVIYKDGLVKEQSPLIVLTNGVADKDNVLTSTNDWSTY